MDKAQHAVGAVLVSTQKYRNIYILILLLGFSVLVQAAPPVPFGRWSQQANGGISATCPAGFRCEDSAIGAGILQRMLTAANGDRYIQLIVTDGSGSSTATTLESYVRANNSSSQGISAKQTLMQNGTNSINSTAIINTGWANTGGPAVQINQSLGSASVPGVGYTSTFDLLINQDANRRQTGYFFGIRQTVTGSAILNGISGAGSDIHTFVLRQAGGNYVSAGSASLPAAAGGMMMGGGMGGGGGGMGGGTAGGGGGMGGGMSGGGTTATTPTTTTPVATTPTTTTTTPVATTTPTTTTTTPVATTPTTTTGGGGGMGMMARQAAVGSSVTSNTVSNSNKLTALALTPSAVPNQDTIPPPPPLATPVTQVAYAPGRIGVVTTTKTENLNTAPDNPFQPNLANERITPLRPAPPVPAVSGVIIAPSLAGPQVPTGNAGGGMGMGMGGGGGPSGGSVSWAAGNDVQAIYIGQVCTGSCATAAMGGMGGMGGMGMMGPTGVFSFQAYDNLSDGAAAIQTRSILDTAPVNWVTSPFGPAPSL